MSRPAHLLGLAACLTTVTLAARPLPAQVPPDDAYRQFDTEHFRVIFPEGREPFARRAAAGAEWAWRALAEHFIAPPGGRIALVITDQFDVAGASATPIPRNRVVLNMAPHLSSRQLNNYPDWIDLTLAHELTHIFHLDRADGLWRVPRALFGRMPFFFPAFYQPRWVIEGLATYYESRLTGAGRATGTYFDMFLSSAAQEDAFRAIDAANGVHPRWPAGQTPYAYGSYYFDHLAASHGDSAIAAFVRKAAGRLPYTLDWAGTPVFGRSLSDAWSTWRSDRRAAAREFVDSLASSGVTRGEPLSAAGWAMAGPRFAPDGKRLAYSIFEPVADPATVVVNLETGSIELRTRRTAITGTTWRPDGSALYYGQTDFIDRYRNYSDLYRIDLPGGDEVRLTRAARLGQPDLSPDGARVVAVQTGEGTNRLVRVELPTLRTRPLTAYVDTVNWGRPRWSPDGRRVVAERWVRGEIVDIVVLKADGELERRITDDAAVDVAPTWSPDGRFVLWSSDRSGVYNVHAVDLGATPITDDGELRTDPPVYRVTRVTGGAFDPDVSPDGRWLAYMAHYADGFRVERIPFDPGGWEPAASVRRTLRPSPWPGGSAARASQVRSYTPFPSLWPSSWFPIAFYDEGPLGAFVGGSTFGTDYVERHQFAAFAGWRFGIDEPEGGLVYRYRGLGDPTFQLSLVQDWDAFRALVDDSIPVTAFEREREARLSARFERPRFRTLFVWSPELTIERFDFSTSDPTVRPARGSDTEVEGSLSLGYSTARRFPRSVSAARGISASLEVSHARRPRGGEPDPWRVSGELVLRGFRDLEIFGHAHHVLAARLALGASSGRRGGTELFPLGGVPGRFDELLPGVTLGGGADYPIRGFEEGIQVGDRILAGSLEYRFPLSLVGRGHGLWPVLLDRLSASLFLDAGSAWRDSERVRALAAAGTELSIDLGVGYVVPYRLRFGLARTLATPAGRGPEWKIYASAGVAF